MTIEPGTTSEGARAEVFREWNRGHGSVRWYEADKVDMALNLLEERVATAETEQARLLAALEMLANQQPHFSQYSTDMPSWEAMRGIARRALGHPDA